MYSCHYLTDDLCRCRKKKTNWNDSDRLSDRKKHYPLLQFSNLNNTNISTVFVAMRISHYRINLTGNLFSFCVRRFLQ